MYQIALTLFGRLFSMPLGGKARTHVEHPNLKIVALHSRGRQASYYENAEKAFSVQCYGYQVNTNRLVLK